jgi:hypothetical protein
MTTLTGKTALVTGASRPWTRERAETRRGRRPGSRSLQQRGEEAERVVGARSARAEGTPTTSGWTLRRPTGRTDSRSGRATATGSTFSTPTPACRKRRASRTRAARLRCVERTGRDADEAFRLAAWRARGVRVNAVAPGVVETVMSSFTKSENGRNYALNLQRIKRLAQPEDISGAVASHEPRWITGEVIHVDGGSKL